MAVFTVRKKYKTKGFMGMIDLTDEFKATVKKSAIKNGMITGYVAGCTAAMSTLEFEPGLVNHDLKAALDIISPFKDERRYGYSL
jgi:thiamine phosphate synthase YjbQ (UPF0047 family)